MQSHLLRAVSLGFLSGLIAALTFAQPSAPTAPGSSTTVMPRLIQYRGVFTDAGGRPLSGLYGVTFFLYRDQQSGAPLWMETQNVTADAKGNYVAQLGATRPEGLPLELFSTGEARWLGVQVAGQPEQPRVLLVAVPYALKAVDAETVGGLLPSAFVLATAPGSGAGTATPTASAATTPVVTPPPVTSNVTTSGGTVNALPLWTTGTNIQSAILTQTATTAINVGGKLNLPATGMATVTAGKNSRPEDFVASVFNSGTATAVAQTFQLQAEPLNNNKTTASGTLNLLYGSGTAIPAETGLKINSKGQITFATGQTFPGTGPGTVTSVGLAAPLSDFTVSGSPVTSSGTLNLGWKAAPTSADTANAIVKRDGTGSFSVTSINGSGTLATGTTNATAILGSTSLDGGVGVHGSATAAGSSLPSFGVVGDSVSSIQFSGGVRGKDASSLPSITEGVQGQSLNPAGIGVLGFDGFNGPSNEFLSHAGSQRIGVWGDAESGSGAIEGIGVIGTSDTGIGVVAENHDGDQFPAMLAIGGNALSGGANSGAPGMSATGGNAGCCDVNSNYGIGGDGIDATGGAAGNSFGIGSGSGGSFSGGAYLTTGGCSGHCGGTGIMASGGYDGNFQNQGFAAVFSGDIKVQGQILATVKDFQIDHPLDPANKYLMHASIESSELMNIYTGNTTTDAQGEAIVQLPEWFEALNTDFRYQLTVIGQFAQAIVAREISGHRFTIRTNAPNVKVSWQVAGVRQDAYAKAHPMVVEQEKNARERGHYIYPELYGAPREDQVQWAGHPQVMKSVKENRTRLLPSRTASAKP